jgi:sialic acid synthase SpsE
MKKEDTMSNGPHAQFGRHTLGQSHPTFIIAEIGATHAGSVDQALKLIEVAADLGAQAVKLQTVNPDYSYVHGTLSHQVFQTLQLSLDEMIRMKKAAEACGLILFSTPGDFPSLELVEKVDFPIMKVSSGLMTNKPLVEAVARTGKPMIISSGMAYLDEIGRSVRFARDAGAKDIAVLHCTALYPCPDNRLNLGAIPEMSRALSVPVGFSDHSPDQLASPIAVALGACAVEKHLALSHELAGPEKGTACDPAQFRAMVQAIRRAEDMRGNGVKAPAPEEAHGRIVHRRTIIACKAIPKGTALSKDNISVMRGTEAHIGLTPELFDSLIGLKAARDIENGEPIKPGLLTESVNE